MLNVVQISNLENKILELQKEMFKLQLECKESMKIKKNENDALQISFVGCDRVLEAMHAWR